MKSHQILKSVFSSSNIKELSEAMKVSLSTLYKWSESPASGSGIPNPLDRIEILITRTGNPGIIEWICSRANGFFVQNLSTRKNVPQSVNHASNHLVREFAEMISTIAAASGDGSISATESTALRNRWNKLQSLSESFVQHCEEGNFDMLQSKLKSTALK